MYTFPFNVTFLLNFFVFMEFSALMLVGQNSYREQTIEEERGEHDWERATSQHLKSCHPTKKIF